MFNPNFKSLIISVIICALLKTVKCAQPTQKRKFVVSDMLELEESTIVNMKAAWNVTNEIYYTGAVNITATKMRDFSHKLISIFTEINDAIKLYERRVIFMQPDKLLNSLIDLRELEPLTVLSDTPTDDPVTHWRVKWVEVSSLGTQIHWLYSKRIRDILTSVPYIKTVATSIARYYGNPWNSVLSGNTEKKRRVAMRYNARLIDERIFSVPQGDLFFGLRKFLNESKTGKSGSAVKTGTCAGEDIIGKIFPVRLDAPLYVLFYLCLVDFKFYVLENYFQIYQEAFEGNLFANYSSSDDRLRQRVRRKVDAYNSSFKDYKADSTEKKIMSGYFHCDPPPIVPTADTRNHRNHETFIRFTNFLTVFVALEKTLSPSGECGGNCKEFGKAKDFCKSSDPTCTENLHPECEKDPALCKKFKPPCQTKDLSCFATGLNSTVCSSEDNVKMYEWIDLDGKVFGPKNDTECGQWASEFEGTTEPIGGKKENCDVCLCQCLEPILIQGNTSSVRTFSMKEVVSRIADNRVVVGFKFEQIADQLHFMIADAVSVAGLMVDKSTISWITQTAADEIKPDETKRLSKTLKSFHMDDIKAPEGAVITGIKFIEKSKPLTAENMQQQMYIGFAIQTTIVDQTTGDLDPSTSTWIENPSIGKTGQYNYVDPDDPVRADGPSVPDSAVDMFIDFRASSFKKDAGQTVIPYFDSHKMSIELIESKTSFALRGVGIFHRQKPGFGGFLGIKILPYGEYNPF